MTTDARETALAELEALSKHFEVIPGNSLHVSIREAINRVACAPSPFCVACGGRAHEEPAEFRAHAVALRDEGATHVALGTMSVTFGPKPGPAITPETVAAAVAKDTAMTGTDDDYIP